MGDTALLGIFGFHFAVSILCLQIVDFGGVVTIARYTLSRIEGAENPFEISRYFWTMCVVRAGVAALLVVAFILYLGYQEKGFSYFYVIGAMPAYLIWIFNPAGLLDGVKASGVAGVTASFPYLISALFIPTGLFVDSERDYGLLLGCALSIGTFLSCAAQWIALSRFNLPLTFVGWRRETLILVLKEGISQILFLLPSQLISRTQIFLVGSTLGASQAGVFVYARQVIAAATQVIGFSLRAEFPALVQRMDCQSKGRWITALINQRFTIGLALIGFLVAFSFPLAATKILPNSFDEPLGAIIALAPLIVTTGLYLVFLRAMMALGWFGSTAILGVLSSVIALFIGWRLVAEWGIPGLMIGEACAHCLGCFLAISVFHVRRNKPRVSKMVD
ncbi:hypothetical protein Thiosp_01304 [Thiorhodovibrio litoralis]|nr:hypothetical protein Thiosp_01304 [Thiorhodovibrio litoralis]